MSTSDQEILRAVNAMAANDDGIMDVGEARHIVAKAAQRMAETDAPDVEFSDWICNSVWETVETATAAWEQVQLVVDQWDELSVESD